MIIPATETVLHTAETSEIEKVAVASYDEDTIACMDCDSDDSTSDTFNSDAKGPLSAPRSILKNRTKVEPRYIRSGSWIVLPAPSQSFLDVSELSMCTLATPCTEISASSTKSVSFDSVQIRSYQLTIGDHPGVSYGPPIQLDWDYQEHEDIELDVYEANRGFSRRTMRQMVMSYYQRKNILEREYGFSEEDLVRAKKDANKIKLQRDLTLALLPMMRVEAALESAGRKAKRAMCKKK
jgi:hypothetical protein